jgi:protein TonB
VFGFDRALDRSSLQVLIVQDEAAATALAEVLQGFQRAGIKAEVVPAASLAARLGPGAVVYLTPETATPALLEQVARARALSITGQASLVDGGRAAVGLEDAGGKAQIVVGVDRVAAEGHDFQAQMLKVARVVKTGAAATGAPAAPAAPAAAAAGDGSKPPVLVAFDRPDYPTMARRMRVEGEVVMRLHVDEVGRVTGVDLVSGVGRAGVDEVALGAARNARFRPATRGGKPVPSTYLLTLPFRL